VSNWKEELLRFYVERKALATGWFQLGSGGWSEIYIDGRMVTTHPPALRVIADGMMETVTRHRLLGPDDIIVAPVVSGVAIGVVLALQANIDLVLDRQKSKEHGMGKRFEGIDLAKLPRPKRALIVDDLMTKGQTLLRTVEGVRDLGIQVDDVLVVVDREEGGDDVLREANVCLHRLLTKREMLEHVGYSSEPKCAVG
jgi:orotate phosphoribosyltransferase